MFQRKGPIEKGFNFEGKAPKRAEYRLKTLNF